MPSFFMGELEARLLLSSLAPVSPPQALPEGAAPDAVHAAPAISTPKAPRIVGKYSGSIKASTPGHAAASVPATITITSQSGGSVRGTLVMKGAKFQLRGTISPYSEVRFNCTRPEAVCILTGRVNAAGMTGKFTGADGDTTVRGTYSLKKQ